MKYFLLFSFWFLPTQLILAQDSGLLNELLQESKADTALLPPKMLLSQRLLWGEKGLMRSTGIAPLNSITRVKELKLRRAMLKSHQVLGFATLGGMLAQGIIGTQLYRGNYKNHELHENLATTINITYSLGAVSSLLAPPPLLSRDKKISSLRLHKWLAVGHLSGMIATNILGNMAEDNAKYKSAHRTAALFTFASFAAATVVITF
ncbi:MAG: hypothetical protein ACO3BD_02880 [Chitinophagaceae bacterium]